MTPVMLLQLHLRLPKSASLRTDAILGRAGGREGWGGGGGQTDGESTDAKNSQFRSRGRILAQTVNVFLGFIQFSVQNKTVSLKICNYAVTITEKLQSN